MPDSGRNTVAVQMALMKKFSFTILLGISILFIAGATPVNAQNLPCWDPITIGYAQIVPTCFSDNQLMLEVNNLSTEYPNVNQRIMGIRLTSDSIDALTSWPSAWYKSVDGNTFTTQTNDLGESIPAYSGATLEANVTGRSAIDAVIWDDGGDGH